MARPVVDPDVTLDFAALTVAQLRGEALNLALVLSLCNDQRGEIFRLIEKRLAEMRAQERIASMTEVQKDALLKALAG